MTEKKRLFYRGVVLALFALWIVVCGISLYALRQSKHNRTANLSAVAVSATNSNAQHQVERTLAELQAFGLGTDTKDNLLYCVGKLRESNSGAPVYVIDAQGNLKDIEGIQGSLGERPDTSAGYAIAPLPEDIAPGGYMLLILRLQDGRYVARGYTRKALGGVLAQEISLQTKHIKMKDEQDNAVWESQAAIVLSPSVDQEKQEQLYNMEIALPTPEGWTLELWLPFSAVQPLMDYRLLLPPLLTITVAMAAFMRNYSQLRNFKEATSRGFYERDQLTGLYNREGIEAHYDEMALTGKLGGYSMICMDIMAFGHFNSIFGYEKGDKLLRAVAKCMGEPCIAARSHGDMFTILVPPDCGCVDKIDMKVNRMITKQLKQSLYQLISFKYGICVLEEGMGFSEAQDRAMLALSEAKEDAQRQFVVYDDGLQKRLDRIRGIEKNMSKALDRHELIIYIQPIISVEDGSCMSGEMLVRWKSPEIGFLAPDQFIPYFEKNGFITELDLYMLDKAFAMINRWQQEYNHSCKLSVNLSQISLTFPNYIDRMEAVSAKYPDVSNEKITIELTESTLGGAADALAAMRRLREMGFTISMDDFGTGYSSLIKLKELPIDVLKLDRGFLNEFTVSDKSQKIVRHIANMAKELDIMTVCEGVETRAHLEFVKRLGCTAVQGYYFSRPLPWDKFEETYINKSSVAMRGSMKQTMMMLEDADEQVKANASIGE